MATHFGGRQEGQSDLRESWETPLPLFKELHAIFRFTVDAFSDGKNNLLPRFWDDAQSEQWKGERVFCNPPFGGEYLDDDRKNRKKSCGDFFPFFQQAQTSVVIAPLTSLATRYCHDFPPQIVILPSEKIAFNKPKGLQVNATSPALAIVILLYGKVSAQQVKRVLAMRSFTAPPVALKWQ